MVTNNYAVIFTDTDGQQQCSRFFQKLSAARKHAKWLAASSWATEVKIYKGGPGEYLVETL